MLCNRVDRDRLRKGFRALNDTDGGTVVTAPIEVFAVVIVVEF
jgi:hypothetical protein